VSNTSRVSTRFFFARLKRRLELLSAGGRWTDQLPPPTRRNLRTFLLDGIFVNSCDSVIVSYMTLYLLALGAAPGQIGLMSALSNLSAALFLLPGATLVERWGRRKPIVLLTGKGMAPLAVVLSALIPLVYAGPTVIYIAIGLAVLRVAMGYLGMPAWTSLSADIVPLSWRGRYFSTRNMIMTVSGIVATYVAGQIITQVGGLAGYQTVLIAAAVMGLGSTMAYSRLEEPALKPHAESRQWDAWKQFFEEMRTRPGFLTFCSASALLSFSLNIASPFFNVYLVENLGATAHIVGILTILGSLSALPGQRLFGVLVDRWGPRRVRIITNLIVPVLPWTWLLVRSPWHTIPARILGGFTWAGYNLANFNLLLTLSTEEQRARYTAVHQIALTLATAAGAALGGLIVEEWGYLITFALSGFGRLLAGLVFIFAAEPSPGRSFLKRQTKQTR